MPGGGSRWVARLFFWSWYPLCFFWKGNRPGQPFFCHLGGGTLENRRTFLFSAICGAGARENTTHTPSPVACPGTLPARVMGTLAACEEHTSGSNGDPSKGSAFRRCSSSRTLGCRLDSPDLRHGNRLEATPKGTPSSHCRQREGPQVEPPRPSWTWTCTPRRTRASRLRRFRLERSIDFGEISRLGQDLKQIGRVTPICLRDGTQRLE